MLFNLGFAFLFFLPVIESFDRQVAFSLLLTGSVLISFPLLRRRKFSFDRVDGLWLLVLSVFTVSAIHSWSLSRSYIELLRYFAYFLIFISIRHYRDSQDLLSKIFIPMVFANSIILSLLFISSPILKWPLPATKMSLFYPISLGHNHIADILIFAIPLSLFIRRKFLSPALSLFFISMLVLSVSRGAMLSLTFAFLIYFAINKLFNKSREYAARRILFLTILTIVFLLSSFIYSNFIVPQDSKENGLKGFYKPVVSENRFGYFIQAWEGFRQSPVYGTGLDTFRFVSKMYQTKPFSWSWYTHNHFLQIFTETGFFGGLLFLGLIFILLFRTFQNSNNLSSTTNHQYHALFIAVLVSTIHSLIDFDWQYISIFLLFFISLAVLNPIKQDKAENSHNFLTVILFSVIIGMYVIPFIFKIDSYKLIAESDEYIKNKNYKKAVNTLQKAYMLDSKNQDVTLRFAELEAQMESSDAAHFWYRNAILLNPLESEWVVRNDLKLYLDQAKAALEGKDYRTASKYITKSVVMYPSYYQFINGDYYMFNAKKLYTDNKTFEARKMLSDYIKTLERQINRKKLSKEEILTVADRLRQNVY